MLILSRKTNQTIHIGDDITVMVTEIRGENVKIGITAPKTVKVYRHEVWLQVQEEQRQADLES